MLFWNKNIGHKHSLVFEWYMARLIIKKHKGQKDTIYDNNGPCPQNKDIIPSSTINTVGRAYVKG